jgi:cation transport ATPase
MNNKKIIVVVDKIEDKSILTFLHKMGGVVKVSVYISTCVIEIDYDSHSLTDKKIVKKIESMNMKVLGYITEDIYDYKTPIFRERRKKIFFRLLLSIIFIFLILYSVYFDIGGVSIIIISFIVTFISGKEIYEKALVSIKKYEFDINIFASIFILFFISISFYSYFFLDLDISVSRFYIIVLFTIILFFNLYQYLNSFVIDKINANFENVFKLLPSFVTLIKNDKQIRTFPSKINEDDLVLVLKGERIPVDGILISKQAKIKQPLNSIDKEIIFKRGDIIYSGAINGGDDIIIRAIKDFKNSLISQIANISKRFYEKRKEIFPDKKVFVYYFYFILIISILSFIYFYFKGENPHIRRIPLFFFPQGYYFSFIIPYFFMINYLSKSGIILNNPSIVFEISSNDVFIIDAGISLFSGMKKEDFIIFIEKLKSYGFKIVCIIPQSLKSIVDELRDIDYFIDVDVSEKHSVVLRYKVFGYRIVAISEGFGNLGMISLSDVGINLVGSFDPVSKISDVVVCRKEVGSIFTFLDSIKKLFYLYRYNLYISVISVFLVYLIFSKYKYSPLIGIFVSVFLVFLSSLRIYFKN